MFKSEKGVSAVEFALIAPLLFVLTFGIIEFGILLFDKAVVTNASREGARAAIVHHELYNEDDTTTYDPVDVNKITEVVEKYTDQYLISLGGSSSLTIHPPLYEPSGFPESGGDVTIRLTYNYQFLVFQSLIGLLGGSEYADGIPLEGKTVMRME